LEVQVGARGRVAGFARVTGLRFVAISIKVGLLPSIKSRSAVSQMFEKRNFPNPNNYFLKLTMDLFAIDSIAQCKFCQDVVEAEWLRGKI
jgi:hypothetical protein